MTYVCDWKGQKVMVLQERELFTLLLQKSMKMLDECSIVRRVGQTYGKEISF